MKNKYRREIWDAENGVIINRIISEATLINQTIEEQNGFCSAGEVISIKQISGKKIN